MDKTPFDLPDNVRRNHMDVSEEGLASASQSEEGLASASQLEEGQKSLRSDCPAPSGPVDHALLQAGSPGPASRKEEALSLGARASVTSFSATKRRQFDGRSRRSSSYPKWRRISWNTDLWFERSLTVFAIFLASSLFFLLAVFFLNVGDVLTLSTHHSLGIIFFSVIRLLFVFLLGSLLSLPISLAATCWATEVAPGWFRKWFEKGMNFFASVPTLIWAAWFIFALTPVFSAHVRFLFPSTVPSLWRDFFYIMCLGAVTTLPSTCMMTLRLLKNRSHGVFESAYALGANRVAILLRLTLPDMKKGLISVLCLSLSRMVAEGLAIAAILPKDSWASFPPAEIVFFLLYGQPKNMQNTSIVASLGLALLFATVAFQIVGQRLLVPEENKKKSSALSSTGLAGIKTGEQGHLPKPFFYLGAVCVMFSFLPLFHLSFWLLAHIPSGFFDLTVPPARDLIHATFSGLKIALSSSSIALMISVLFGSTISEFQHRRRGRFSTLVVHTLGGISPLLILAAFWVLFSNGGLEFGYVTSVLMLVMSLLPVLIQKVTLAYQNASFEIRDTIVALGVSRIRAAFFLVTRLGHKAIFMGSLLTLIQALGEVAPVLLLQEPTLSQHFFFSTVAGDHSLFVHCALIWFFLSLAAHVATWISSSSYKEKRQSFE